VKGKFTRRRLSDFSFIIIGVCRTADLALRRPVPAARQVGGASLGVRKLFSCYTYISMYEDSGWLSDCLRICSWQADF
jgi:hypothetical protein